MDYSISEYARIRLEGFNENIKILELLLDNQEDKYIKENDYAVKLKQQKERASTDYKLACIDSFEGDVSMFYESRQYYRQASFLLLYSFLEDSLKKICELLRL